MEYSQIKHFYTSRLQPTLFEPFEIEYFPPQTESDGQVSKKKKSSAGCPFYRQSSVARLSDELLLGVRDLEQMVTAGRGGSACPYYAARAAVQDAELVVLPYNTLLHKGTREASRICLKVVNVVFSSSSRRSVGLMSSPINHQDCHNCRID